MAARQGYKLPKMTDPKRFEQMVKDCANKKYDKTFNLYGRTGQNQHGIDIYAIDKFEEVIQCKNYTTNDIQALKNDINGDFKKACDYFCQEKGWQFTRFIVATAIDKDKKGDDIIIEHNLESNIEIEFWFWEDIQDMVLEDTNLLIKYYENFVIDLNELKIVSTDNQAYADSFSKTLFLHTKPEDRKVNLCNLFVMPKYKVYESDEPQTDLEDKLVSFLNSDTQFLFIEGDAGCGKSTLVSWLNYNNLKSDDDETKINIFKDIHVITIRLRDLEKIISSEKSLIDSILQRMNLDSYEDMESRFPKAVMILDGFDELCMIEGINNYNELIEELEEIDLKGYKYIITSRPHYIKIGIKLSYERITLQHFDEEKRKEWITHYTSPDYCGQSLNDEIQQYIVDINDDTDSAICDTPMTLYMLAANKEINRNIELTRNSWELYHQIFYNELLDTDYNKMFGRKHRHRAYSKKNLLYRITEEIAYNMYLSNNNQFYVSSGELKEIINKLVGDNTQLKNMDYLIEQCYALCNYWKETGDGAVEFYHNNIRDFFLCEKIYSELNAIYNLRDTPENKTDKIIKFFLKFKKAPLQDMVCKFILLRAEKDVDNSDSFVYQEKEMRLLPHFFEKMLTNGKLYDNLNEDKHIQAVVNILSCAAQVYRHIYEPVLTQTGEQYVKWWNDVDNINQNSDIIKYLFKAIFNHKFMAINGKISNRIDCSGVDLRGTDLRDADLKSTDLRDADLRGANLKGANLIGACLQSEYSKNTPLKGSHLRFVNLRGTDLSSAILRDVNLKGLDLRGADLRGADLTGATLTTTLLLNANLIDARLTGAYLINTYLEGANLKVANLNGAYLSNAKLIYADLRGADLRGADLIDADFNGANLRGADLTDAYI